MSHPDGGSLKKKDIDKIHEAIARLRKDKNIVNRDIKDDVFILLENECKVLYYPIHDSKLWAFYQKDKYEDGSPRKFVFINTSLPYEKQIFAAAHELAHIWNVASDTPEKLVSSSDDDSPIRMEEAVADDPSKDELIANRFAAEFLMNAETIKGMYKKWIQNNDPLSSDDKRMDFILSLMDYYIAPYKMTVLRLEELGIISSADAEKLLAVPRDGENSINHLQKRMGRCARNNEITKTKKFANFIDLAIQDYRKERITFSKMKQLMSIFGMTPEEMGISEEEDPQYFSSEELEAMAEDK